MMIPLVTLYSSLNLENVSKSVFDFDNSIFAKIPNLEILKPSHKLSDNLKKILKENSKSGLGILILSGGVESIAADIISLTDGPILLLINSKNNSLAAGLEIYGKFRNECNIRLISYEDYPEKVKNNFNLMNVFNKINSLRLLEIGEPSPWLLTSKNKNSFTTFDSELRHIELSEIGKHRSNIDKAELEKTIELFNSNFKNGTDSINEIKKSAEIYLSLKSIIKKEKADGVSVRCFDLLDDEVTACLALSELNDEGIIAGCEGDLQALITLVLVKELFNTGGWMANPSGLNFDENTFKLAHCTVPNSMLQESGELDSHFESGKSLGIRGKLKKGSVTIVRIGGEFDKVQIAEGEIVENENFSPDLCRTQVTIRLKRDLSEWLDNALGNHQIMFYGHHADTVKEFAKLTGLEIV